MACMEFEMGKVSNSSGMASAMTLPGQQGWDAGVCEWQ